MLDLGRIFFTNLSLTCFLTQECIGLVFYCVYRAVSNDFFHVTANQQALTVVDTPLDTSYRCRTQNFKVLNFDLKKQITKFKPRLKECCGINPNPIQWKNKSWARK